MSAEVKLRFLGQSVIRGQLNVMSGLHIGGGKDRSGIGGIDSPVIKTPEGDPYIPASSLKGKLRFLLEWAFGKVNASGQVWGSEGQEFEPEDAVLRIFGTSAKRDAWSGGPTRLLMRDCFLLDHWRSKTLDAGRELTEEKTEVVIDRIAGSALDGVGARQIERVPPGAEFEFEAVFRIYEYESDQGARDLECLAWLIQGLDLLQQDALGGSGSRGYGRIGFSGLKLEMAGREPVQLDNVFSGHPFSPNAPPADILNAVKSINALQPAG